MGLTVLILIIVALLGHFAFIKITSAPKRQTPGVESLAHAETQLDGELHVMSVNLAHGRANGKHQTRQSTEEIKSNLNDVAEFLKTNQPDIVAVQEADKQAFWSGSFNHVEHLANNASYPYYLNGAHMSGLGLHYGTGFLSRVKAEDHLVYTFDSSFPTPSKGFTVYQISLDQKTVDLLSVHFDYARSSVRKRQKNELIALIKERGNPCIIIGDFNSKWHKENSTIKQIVNELELTTHEPEADIITFPRFNSRLDWILISKELEMSGFTVHEGTISDHYAVSAKIRFRESIPPE